LGRAFQKKSRSCFWIIALKKQISSFISGFKTQQTSGFDELLKTLKNEVAENTGLKP